MRHTMLLTLAIATAGCAGQRQPEPTVEHVPANPALITPDIYENRVAGSTRDNDQVRTGRYTLTSTSPSTAQEDLMSQIIEVTIPGSLKPTVGDALKHALSRSGYALSPSSTVTSVLYSRPLPAAHYKLGPMRLRDTMQVLAGPAWQVKVDEVTRQVEFTLRSGYQAPTHKPEPAATSSLADLPDLPPKPSRSANTSTLTHSATAITAAGAAPTPTAGTVPPATITTSLSSAQSAGLPTVSSTVATLPANPPATPSKPVVSPAPRIKPLTEVWAAEAGSTLRQSVEEWAKRAGWTVIWAQDDLNYPIEASLRFEGSFQDVIEQVFPLYDQAPRSFVVDGSSSQKLVHIAERKKK